MGDIIYYGLVYLMLIGIPLYEGYKIWFKKPNIVESEELIKKYTNLERNRKCYRSLK